MRFFLCFEKCVAAAQESGGIANVLATANSSTRLVSVGGCFMVALAPLSVNHALAQCCENPRELTFTTGSAQP